MSITGFKFIKFACALMLGVTVVVGASSFAAAEKQAQQAQPTAPLHKSTHKKKAKQEAPPPPLPSGPTGPVQQMPLDAITAMAPQVSFQNNQLTIVAPNSTLADILRAVRKQTGAEIDIPPAPERVVTHLGPGPAREIIAELLNGSRFNYVLLGSPADETVLTRVVLVAKSGPEVAPGPATPAASNAQPAVPQANNAVEDKASDADAEAAEDNMNNADDASAPQEPAEPEQPANNGEQPAVKTPQQMLQEMQQRQMQLQQQQGGQVPPGSGMPPHPPQEQ